MITIKQLHSDKDWLGALHLALPTLGVIFVSSVVTLGLGGVYSSKVSNEHNSESTARLAFYVGTVSLLSALASLAFVALHLRHLVSHLLGLIFSVGFLVAWIVQWSIWIDCEITGPGVLERRPDYCPHCGPNGLTNGRVAFGVVAIAALLAYMSVSIVGLVKVKKTRAAGVEIKERPIAAQP